MVDIIPFGGDWERSLLGPHFAAFGAPGTGKSLLLEMIMRAALGNGFLSRALVYDPKAAMSPRIYGGCGVPEAKVIHLNPLDARGYAFDLATDLRSEADIQQFAAKLIPQEKETNPFFPLSAQILFQQPAYAFMRWVPGQWNFNDWIQVSLNEEHFLKVLRSTESGAIVASSMLGENKNSDVLMTLQARLRQYELVAAALVGAKPFSLRRWMEATEDHEVVVLTTSRQHSAALDPYLGAVLDFVSQLLMDRADVDESVPNDLTWMLIDEARLAKQFGLLNEALLLTRSKGARFVVNVQAISGAEDAWGRERAHEMLDMFDQMAFCRINGPTTQRVASELCGSERDYLASYSEQVGGQGARTTSVALTDVPYYVPSDFGRIPNPSPLTGIDAIFRVQSERYQTHMPPEYCSRWLPFASRKPEHAGFIPRDQPFMHRPPISPAVCRAFGLTGAVGAERERAILI